MVVAGAEETVGQAGVIGNAGGVGEGVRGVGPDIGRGAVLDSSCSAGSTDG